MDSMGMYKFNHSSGDVVLLQ
jgi:hypothetical protein